MYLERFDIDGVEAVALNPQAKRIKNQIETRAVKYAFRYRSALLVLYGALFINIVIDHIQLLAGTEPAPSAVYIWTIALAAIGLIMVIPLANAGPRLINQAIERKYALDGDYRELMVTANDFSGLLLLSDEAKKIVTDEQLYKVFTNFDVVLRDGMLRRAEDRTLSGVRDALHNKKKIIEIAVSVIGNYPFLHRAVNDAVAAYDRDLEKAKHLHKQEARLLSEL